MRYLYHLTEGNRGPVTFEQLQELAKAGTIDNMTPILAEGAREWSRWLFIKDTPQTSASAATPTPATKPAPAPTQKKEEKKPEVTPAPAPTPAPVEKQTIPVAEATKLEAPKAEEPSKPVEAPKPESKPLAQAGSTEQTAVPADAEDQGKAATFSLSAFVAELNLKKLIPTGVSAVVTLLSLLAACVWTIMAHDTEQEYTQLQDMAAEHEQSRQSLDNLSASRQQVQAETLKLNEDYRRMQETLKLTQEESARLAKGPFISEAEAKQLKDEQAKAARLKEQEQKL